MNDLTFVEIEKEALSHNVRTIRELIGKNTVFCPCVKANAYGHGLVDASRIFLESGADFLGVNSLYEACTLRENEIDCPIYLLGYLALNQIEEALSLSLQFVCYNYETLDKIAEVRGNKEVKIHIKVETGNNRQGILLEDVEKFAKYAKSKNIVVEGITTHFANIEDTTDQSYAMKQFDTFSKSIQILEKAGFSVPLRHCANSAATMLFDKVRLTMVRPGIACYGMWPSGETHVSVLNQGKNVELKPAFTWKSKIAQIKSVAEGEFIGYGLTYRTGRNSKIGIVPVGYYDGYDRGLKGAFVLVKGKRAYVRGRICMNIIMVDLTDIPDVCLEDEVVLIGKQGEEFISAETFAKWADTINYEVTCRVNDRIPRIVL
ncbi:MAG: alanine racemase [Candidatus Gracilibacteria bacterium]|jgi:alanine racemase|nr:alanine racemase [Candidatus Gracilibacteria bacterium]